MPLTRRHLLSTWAVCPLFLRSVSPPVFPLIPDAPRARRPAFRFPPRWDAWDAARWRAFEADLGEPDNGNAPQGEPADPAGPPNRVLAGGRVRGGEIAAAVDPVDPAASFRRLGRLLVPPWPGRLAEVVVIWLSADLACADWRAVHARWLRAGRAGAWYRAGARMYGEVDGRD